MANKLRVSSVNYLLIISILCLAFVLQGCTENSSLKIPDKHNNNNKEKSQTESPSDIKVLSVDALVEKNQAQENLVSSFTIGMIGDVLFHEWLIEGGLQEDGSYAYPYIYEYLEADIRKLDFAMFNLEGTLAGPPYLGYPSFSAPAGLADAMAEKGFQLALTANNHSLDRGMEGMNATIEAIRKAGMQNLGTRKTGDPDYFSTELNGIKVAISTATYTTSKINGLTSLNGIPIPAESDHLVDTFSLEDAYIDQDITKIQERAQKMRSDGNEVVIFVMHWGTEYSLEEDWYQEVYAQALADAGVDLVIGTHPHVIQPIKTVRSSDGQHNMPVYYSLGNSVSDQHYNTGGMEGQPLDGLMAIITFERNRTGEISISEFGYMATYCNMIKISSDATQSQVIPVQRALENPEAYGIFDISLIEGSRNRTNSIMAENSLEGIEIKNYDSVPEY